MKKDIEAEVLDSFYKRAPNFLTLDNLHFDIPDVDVQNIEQVLNKLSNLGQLRVTSAQGATNAHYELASYENVRFKEYIEIGGIKVRRLLTHDRPRPEDINIFVEALVKRTLSLEAEFERRLDAKLRDYWSNVIVLFGIFVAVFSIVVTFVGKIEVKQGGTFCDVLLINFAQVTPIAIVLGLFVLLIKKLFLAR